MTNRDKIFLQMSLFFLLFLTILILGALFSINIKSDKINKQLKTIVKLEERQNAKTLETTTPELVIEENTLGR